VDRKDALTAGHLLFEYSPSHISTMLQLLGVSGSQAPRIDLVSTSFGRQAEWMQGTGLVPAEFNGTAPLVEPLYGTRYWTRPVLGMREKWQR